MSPKDELKNPTIKGANNGFVNGLTNGLTNGNSKTNSLVNGKNNAGGSVKKSIMETTRGRLGVWAVVGVVLLLIFGAFAFSTNFLKGINWNGIKKYVDVDINRIDNPNINITKFAFHQENGNFYFYLEFAGKFTTTGAYKNLAYILIEDDSANAPKYNASYLWPNYIIKLVGYDGSVTGYLMEYAGNGHNWNWTIIGGVGVTEKGQVVQGEVTQTFSANSKIMVIAQSYYTQDITPVVGLEKPALLVIQNPSGDSLNLRLIPLYGEVNVDKILIHISKNIKIVNSNILENIGKISSEKIVDVNIYPISNGSAKAWVSGVDASTNYVTIWGSEFKKYYGIPKGIVIDGIFNDWKSIQKKSPTGHVDNPNIDIENYANTTYANTNYFYLSVRGSMLNGNIAPEIEKVKPSGGGGGGGKAKPREPYDYAEIDFISSDGKQHTVKIWGYMGIVTKIIFDGKDGSSVIKVGVGKDGKYGALEVEIKGNYKIVSYSIKMTDWDGVNNIAVRALMRPINIRALSGWILVGSSSTTGGNGANLTTYYLGWDDTNLYLNLSTNNIASWDVAYGFALDVDQAAGSGFMFSSSGDAWGRHIDFNNSGSYLPDYEIYVWWSGTDGKITSDDLCTWDGSGWTYTKFSAAGITNISKGDSSIGLQWINITIPWNSIGGKPATGKIATMAWVAGGSGSSAVDTVPDDSSVPSGDSWTDWDSFSSMTVEPVPEFSSVPAISIFIIVIIPVIIYKKREK